MLTETLTISQKAKFWFRFVSYRLYCFLLNLTLFFSTLLKAKFNPRNSYESLGVWNVVMILEKEVVMKS